VAFQRGNAAARDRLGDASDRGSFGEAPGLAHAYERPAATDEVHDQTLCQFDIKLFIFVLDSMMGLGETE